MFDRRLDDDDMNELLACDVPMLLSEDFDELKSAGVLGDKVRFGVSITDPPEFKPVRMFIGLGSDGGEILMIDPPESPNRG